jgi:hypothetical protein
MARHEPVRRGRRSPVRRSTRRFLVYCGGERTECSYLDGLNAAYRGGPITLDIQHKGRTDPRRVVEAAVRHAQNKPGLYDEVWCVVDVDHFDIAPAISAAAKHGIELAISNPCFELWLLLHHSPHNSHLARCDDAIGKLRKHLPAYDKAGLDFGDFVSGVGAAVKRAKELDPGRNPSTGVWRLVEKVVAQ